MSLWHKEKPDSIGAAYDEAFRKIKWKSLSLDAAPIVVLDTETTGFDPSTDRILSVGLVTIKNDTIEINQTKEWIIQQDPSRIQQSSTVHGLLSTDLEDGSSEASFIDKFLPLIAGKVVVGHHIGYDTRMLAEAFKRHAKVRWMNPTIDTAHLAMQELVPFHRTGYANQRPPSLDAVCSQLSIYPTERHSAWGDALTTAEIFLTLCAHLRKRIGRNPRLRDLPLQK